MPQTLISPGDGQSKKDRYDLDSHKPLLNSLLYFVQNVDNEVPWPLDVLDQKGTDANPEIASLSRAIRAGWIEKRPVKLEGMTVGRFFAPTAVGMQVLRQHYEDKAAELAKLHTHLAHWEHRSSKLFPVVPED